MLVLSKSNGCNVVDKFIIYNTYSMRLHIFPCSNAVHCTCDASMLAETKPIYIVLERV